MVSMVMCEFRMKSKEILKSSMPASMENSIDRIDISISDVIPTQVGIEETQIKLKNPTPAGVRCYGYATVAQLNNQHNPTGLFRLRNK